MTSPKIATMLPSASEIVCALGYESSIVAKSHECDFPDSIKNLPTCTESKLDKHKPSREIDDQVKFIVSEGLSVYRVNAELLQKLIPDIVVTQTQCEVCAASPKDLENALANWFGTKPRIVSLEPNTLADIWMDIQKVASAVGAPERGKVLVSNLRERMNSVNYEVQKYVSQRNSKDSVIPTKRIACIEWIDPLMAAGNWIPELVSLAGGESLFCLAGQHSPWLSWEALLAADPDVIVIMPCGYDIEESMRNMPALEEHPRWPELQAVSQKEVYIVDGNQFFNRPGPRVVESLEMMAQLVWPEIFQDNVAFEGKGWIRL